MQRLCSICRLQRHLHFRPHGCEHPSRCLRFPAPERQPGCLFFFNGLCRALSVRRGTKLHAQQPRVTEHVHR
ncbi:unnamed protein product [Fusarium graminearum]|nr:unnamed protein product [Fusarium graminearum]